MSPVRIGFNSGSLKKHKYNEHLGILGVSKAKHYLSSPSFSLLCSIFSSSSTIDTSMSETNKKDIKISIIMTERVLTVM